MPSVQNVCTSWRKEIKRSTRKVKRLTCCENQTRLFRLVIRGSIEHNVSWHHSTTAACTTMVFSQYSVHTEYVNHYIKKVLLHAIIRLQYLFICRYNNTSGSGIYHNYTFPCGLKYSQYTNTIIWVPLDKVYLKNMAIIWWYTSTTKVYNTAPVST